MLKFHKNPTSDRVLSCGAQVALSPLSIWLARGMKALMPLAHSMWAAEYARHGILVRKSWILDSSTDAVDMIKRFNRSLSVHARRHHTLNILSFDFKNMYTNIDLQDLKNRLATFFADAFALRAQHSERQGEILRVDRRGEASWVQDVRNLQFYQ